MSVTPRPCFGVPVTATLQPLPVKLCKQWVVQYCGTLAVFLISTQIQEFVGSCQSFVAVSLLQVALDCCEGSSQREAMGNLLRKVDEDKTLKVETSGGCERILPWTPASAGQLGGKFKHL